MRRVWPLQDAKNKLSEVVDRAIDEGPQTITRRGREMAVVVSVEDFRRLARPDESLVSFFRNSPLVGVDLELERVDDSGRKVDLLKSLLDTCVLSELASATDSLRRLGLQPDSLSLPTTWSTSGNPSARYSIRGGVSLG